MNEAPLWSVPVRVEDVPEEGCELELTADALVRAALARSAGLIDIQRLNARFHVLREGQGGLHIIGTVSARVEQTCVITLDPVTNEITEAVDVVFDPAARDTPLAGEDETLAGEPEPAEPLVGGAVDLGALAADFLLLGIDPYPRKPGATFSPPEAPPNDEESHPFAVLAALKNKPQEEK